MAKIQNINPESTGAIQEEKLRLKNTADESLCKHILNASFDEPYTDKQRENASRAVLNSFAKGDLVLNETADKRLESFVNYRRDAEKLMYFGLGLLVAIPIVFGAAAMLMHRGVFVWG